VLRDFRDRHPGVELRVAHLSGGSVEMAVQVAEGALDLAFVALTIVLFVGLAFAVRAVERL